MVEDRKKFKHVRTLSLVALTCAAAGTCAFSGSLFSSDASQQEDVATTQASQEQKKKTKEELLSKENIARISQAYGHFIAKSLDNPILVLSFDDVVKGMTDQRAGVASPLTEQDYEDALTQIQEVAFQEMAEKNLREAEEFLKENANKKGVQVLEGGKVQILIEKPGDGNAVVTEEVLPVIHYTGSYLNGTVFGSSEEGKEPFAIALNQTIPGFKAGILGMKLGEEREIFIHPSLGYGTSGQLAPNALLIFKVKLVRIDPLPSGHDKEESDADGDDDFDISLNDDDDQGDDEEVVEEFVDVGDADDDASDQDIDFDTPDDGTSSYGG